MIFVKYDYGRRGACVDIFQKGFTFFLFLICRLSTHVLGMHCQLSTQNLAEKLCVKNDFFCLEKKKYKAVIEQYYIF